MAQQQDRTPKGRGDAGVALLKQQFSELASSRGAWRAVDKSERKPDNRIKPPELRDHQRAKRSQLGPEARISRLLERWERVLSREPSSPGRETGRDRLEVSLLKKAVLNIGNPGLVEKIALALYTSEKKAATERGQGGQAAPFEQVKKDYIKLVHEKHDAQRKSLSEWTSYLGKNDAQYPAWFRYLAVRGVLKMGEFDRGAPKFGNRTHDTVAAFPELNAEALGYVFKVLSEPHAAKVPKTDILLQPFRDALASKSFSALYAVALVECNQTVDRSRIEGEWRKYRRGSNPAILERDLEGKGTGWCTASGSAPEQLKGGDFYVYYTMDKHETYTVPRVAIRMENGQISEIRGIAARQELEPQFVEVVEQKGDQLPGYENFKKASADMKRLTEIDRRCVRRDAEGNFQSVITPEASLSKDDLRFLYEVDSEISSFGYVRDPRIDEIRAGRRDQRGDYAQAFGIDRGRVALTKNEITEDTRLYIGGLSPDDYEILEGRSTPITILGEVSFAGCTSLTSIPDGVSFAGWAGFSGCTSLTSIPDGVSFARSAYFSGCTSLASIPDGVSFAGSANFEGCTSLASIGNGVSFAGSANFEGCTSLASIGDGVRFARNAFFEGCTSLASIPDGVSFAGGANFDGCTSLASIGDGVSFAGDANFDGCTSLASIGDGVSFAGDANFKGCTSLASIGDGVSFAGDAKFTDCTSLESIPDGVSFAGGAMFWRCTSLVAIGTGVSFRGYTSFDDCTSLASIGGEVSFRRNADFNGCTSLESIGDWVSIRGEANFNGCTSLESIGDWVSIRGEANFNDCTSLQSIGEGVRFRGKADFTGCSSLASIGEGVSFARDASFNDCTSLESIGHGVRFARNAFFEGCTSLASIGDGVSFAREVSFEDCASKISIGDGVSFAQGARFKD